MSIPCFSSNDHTFYHVRDRLFITLHSVLYESFALAIVMLINYIPLIVCTFVVCGIFVPYLIYLGTFLKFRITPDALLIWRFNPLIPITISWSFIQKVTPTKECYKIMGVDGKVLATFNCKMERFDAFLQILRSKKILVEDKQPHYKLPHVGNDAENVGSPRDALLSSERKIRTAESFWILLAAGILFFMLGFVPLAVAIGSFRSIPIGIVVMVLIAILLFECAIIFFEFGLNGFVIMRSDGMDFQKIIGRRYFVTWSEMHYVRIVEVPVRNKGGSYVSPQIRFYQRGHADYVAWMLVSNATLALLPEIKSHGIPVLKETEELKSVA